MPSYNEARKDTFLSAVAARILGVPLKNSTLDGYTAIWVCGSVIREKEVRQGSHRIWHLPDKGILRSGEYQDFKFEGNQVYFFDMRADAMPVEECYRPVSLEPPSPRHPRLKPGGGFDSCQHQCLEQLADCRRACFDKNLHPDSLGWTDEMRQQCADECHGEYRRCVDQCGGGGGNPGL